MALVDFTYGTVTDVETGESINVRKPDTNEKIVAWGAALNELAKQTVFSDERYQPTKLEILNAHPYFIVGNNPNHASPPVGYISNENVQLRAVAFKVIPGTFEVRFKSLKDANVTEATVAYAISESAVVSGIEIGRYPISYDSGSIIPLQGRYYISIPTDVVLSTIGDSVSGTVQFIITEHGLISYPPYNLGSVSAATYNQLVEGVSIVVPEVSGDKI